MPIGQKVVSCVVILTSIQQTSAKVGWRLGYWHDRQCSTWQKDVKSTSRYNCQDLLSRPQKLRGIKIAVCAYNRIVGYSYMDLATRKRERPRMAVTDSLTEARRLAKQQRNARRSGGNVLASSSLA